MITPVVLLFLNTTSAQWTAIPTGTTDELEAVVILGEDDFLVAGEDGAAFRTTDGGTTWTPAIGLGNETIRDLIRLDAQTLLGASDGFVVRSVDNGDTWTAISVPAPDDLHALARSGDTVLGVGRSGGIITSDDLGLTWTLHTSGVSERLFCAWAFDASNMIAAGRDGIAVRTSNGMTWTPVALPGSDDWDDVRFFPSTPAIGLMAGEDGTLLRTTDTGLTWTVTNTGSAMGLTAITITEAGEAIITGTTGTGIRSTDQGQTWSIMTSPVKSSLNNVDAMGHTVVACGANGSVLKFGNAVGIAEQYRSTELHVWPLPAKEVLNFRTNGPAGPTSIDVLSVDGKVVAHHSDRSGEGSIDVSGLSAGHYHLRARDIRGHDQFSRVTIVR